MKSRSVIPIFLVFLLATLAFGIGGDKGDRKGHQPGKQKGPIEVSFFVFVVDIDDINGAAQNFTVNVFIRLDWKDDSLVGKADVVRRIPLQDVWNPRVIIANKQTFVRKSMPEVVEVQPNGMVTYRQRYVGPLSQPLNLSEFPFDQHRFTIQFVAAGYSPQDIRFIPGSAREDIPQTGGGIYHNLSLPDWYITNYQVQAHPFEPLPGTKTAGFHFEFTAKRYRLYYIWQVIVPLFLIVVMSWGALWIDPTSSGTQIGLSTSSIITLIAYRFMLGNLIPRLPYMTRLDYFTLGSTVLVFLMLVEVLATSYLARHNMEKFARKMDRCFRLIFPTAFILWSARSLLL